jgi:hypothetical protein
LRKRETEFSNTIEFVWRQQSEQSNVSMKFNVNVRKTFTWKGTRKKRTNPRKRERKKEREREIIFKKTTSA